MKKKIVKFTIAKNSAKNCAIICNRKKFEKIIHVEKKSQNFTVIFTFANFLRNFAHFLVKNFALCKKNHVFFTQNIAEKYSMQKLPQKFTKK